MAETYSSGYFSNLFSDDIPLDLEEEEDEEETLYKPGQFSLKQEEEVPIEEPPEMEEAPIPATQERGRFTLPDTQQPSPIEQDINLESIDASRKMAYGAAQETMILGNMIRYGEALVDSSQNKKLNFSEALSEIEDERQRDIFARFPEFQGLDIYDEDAAIISGRVGTAFVDPVSWALPWMKIAKAGKLASTTAGAAFAAGDTALREKMLFGEVNPYTLGFSTVIGGGAGALSAVLANRVGRKSLDKVMKVYDDPDLTKAIPLEAVPEFRMTVSGPAGRPIFRRERIEPLSFDDLDVIEGAAKKALPETVVELIEKNVPALTPMFRQVRELKDQASRIRTAGGDRKAAAKLDREAKKLTQELFDGRIKHAEGTSEGLVKIMEQLEADETLTDKILKTLLYEQTRPIAGGFGGFTVGWLTGVEDDDALFYGLIGAGATTMYLQKKIQSSKLSSFNKDKAKLALEDTARSNLKTALKIYTSFGSATKLNAMGGWAKYIGNRLLPRIGGADDALELQVVRHENEFIKGTLDIFGESATDMSIRQVVGEAMDRFIDIDVIKAGYRGLDNSLAPLTEQQLLEARRIVPILRPHQETIKDGMGKVGIDLADDLGDEFGMSQSWAVDKIRKRQSSFYDDLTHARDLQVKNGGDNFRPKSFMDSVGGMHELEAGKYRRGGVIPFARKKGQAPKFRPIAEHFEAERILKDTEARIFMAKQGWLNLDAIDVVNTYAQKGIKAMDFAREFGANGELINFALKDIYKTFKTAGSEYEKFGQQYTDQITGAIEAYWGRYGLREDSIYKRAQTTTMALLTTLANTAYLPIVAISSTGDLIQTFQNTGFGIASKAFAKRTISPKYRFSKMTHFAHDGAWERELRAYMTAGGDSFSKWQNRANAWNRGFMKWIGQRGITRAGRSFAYDVGVNAAWDIAKNRKLTKATVQEMEQLRLFPEDLKVISKYDTITDAFDAGDARVIMDRAGQSVAERDAIIPTAANRLLFTQSRDPIVRSFGQFLSWAQAKSSQTNALLTRIENGDAKQAVRMLGTIPIYMGVQNVKEWAKPSYDPYDPEPYDPFSREGIAKALSLSGNFLMWPLEKIIGAIRSYSNTRDLGAQISPVAGLVSNWATQLSKFGSNISNDDVEGALGNLVDAIPAVKELKGYANRVGIPILEDEPTEPEPEHVSTYAIGGLVEDVPGVPEEPDERIDKMTGRPYNEQAGGAFIDEEDRGPAEELDRLGYAEGGFFERAWEGLKEGAQQIFTGEGREEEIERRKTVLQDAYRQLPTAARLYVEHGAGKKEPVGAQDFTNEELGVIQRMVQDTHKKNIADERRLQEELQENIAIRKTPEYSDKEVNERFRQKTFRTTNIGEGLGRTYAEDIENNIKMLEQKLGTYDIDRSKISVDALSENIRHWEEAGGETVPSGDIPQDRQGFKSFSDSLSSPIYNVTASLGRFNAYLSDDGTKIKIADTYNYRWDDTKERYSMETYLRGLSNIESPRHLAKMLASLAFRDSPPRAVEFTIPYSGNVRGADD